jgi:Flp pilus assembly protein TadD
MRLLIAFLMILSGCIARQPRPKEIIDADIECGIRRLRENDLNKAEEIFEKILLEVPRAEALDGLGCVAFYRGDYKLAQAKFEEAMSLDPLYQGARFNLAVLYDITGESDLAQSIYAGLASSGKDFRVLNNFAVLNFEKDGYSNQVEGLLLSANSISPSFAVNENLALIKRKRR